MILDIGAQGGSVPDFAISFQGLLTWNFVGWYRTSIRTTASGWISGFPSQGRCGRRPCNTQINSHTTVLFKLSWNLTGSYKPSVRTIVRSWIFEFSTMGLLGWAETCNYANLHNRYEGTCRNEVRKTFWIPEPLPRLLDNSDHLLFHILFESSHLPN